MGTFIISRSGAESHGAENFGDRGENRHYYARKIFYLSYNLLYHLYI